MSSNDDKGNGKNNDGKNSGKATTELRDPKEIAQETVSKGQAKAQRGTVALISLGLLAGVYIAFGSLFSTVATAGADSWAFGPAQVLAGVVFSLGLILVLVGGAELFTGNTLMVVAGVEDRADTGPIVWALTLAWITNFIGSLLIVVLAFLAGVHTAGDGAVGVSALKTAELKAAKTFFEVLASGVIANMLVCLAVWMAFGAKTAVGKVAVIVPPIAAFVAIGLEHSVANMSLLPMGLSVYEFADPEFWIKADVSRDDYPGLTWAGSARNLVASTIGNMLGGALIGMTYWAAYLRKGSD
jgi:formate transporter